MKRDEMEESQGQQQISPLQVASRMGSKRSAMNYSPWSRYGNKAGTESRFTKVGRNRDESRF